MNHTKELATALVCGGVLLSFVVGMRCGANGMCASAEAERNALISSYENRLAELTEELEREKQTEHITVTEEYIPLSVSYETVTEIRETDAVILAKTMWGEYRNADNYAQCAAVCWCIFNRCDADGLTVEQAATTGQFLGYSAGNPVDAELYGIACDCLLRWETERLGVNVNVGRVIPAGYCWMEGNGTVNTYRNAYIGGEYITP